MNNPFDEFMAIVNEMVNPAMDLVISAGPLAYILTVISCALALITLLAYVILYPVMKAFGWTNKVQ